MSHVKSPVLFFLFLLFGLFLSESKDMLSYARVNLGLIIWEKLNLAQGEFLNHSPTLLLSSFDSNLDKSNWYCNQELFQRPRWEIKSRDDLQKILALFESAADGAQYISASRYQAEILWSLGNRNEAILIMNSIVQQDNNELNWAILGNFYSESGFPTNAAHAYEQIDNNCRNLKLQASYIASIQEGLIRDGSVEMENFTNEALNLSSPILCLSTYLDNSRTVRMIQHDDEKMMYSLIDFLPNNETLEKCINDRLSYLVESGDWTAQDVCDLAHLWHWQHQVVSHLQTDNNKLIEFCDTQFLDLGMQVQQNFLETEEDLQAFIQGKLQIPSELLEFGGNLVSGGSFNNEEFINWKWHQWMYEPLFPESIFIGGLVSETGYPHGNALRIQGIKSGQYIDEDVNRPRVFVGYSTNTGTLLNAPNQAYAISLLYKTQNLRDRRPAVAILDSEGGQVVSFQLAPTEGKWRQIAIIFKIDLAVEQSRLALLMPARGVVTYDQVAFWTLTHTNNNHFSEQLPKRIDIE